MDGEGSLTYQESHANGTWKNGQLQDTKGPLVTKKGTYFGNYKNGLMHDEDARFVYNDGK